MRFQGQSYFNSAGELYRFAGIAQEVKTDVTQQVLAQKEIEVSEQLLHDIVLWAPIGIGIVNAADLVIESVNDMFIQIAGKPYEQLVGHNYWVPFAEAASVRYNHRKLMSHLLYG